MLSSNSGSESSWEGLDTTLIFEYAHLPNKEEVKERRRMSYSAEFDAITQ